MPDEKQEKGRVVYSRLEGAGEGGSAREGKVAEFAAALAHDSLWRALLPLFVGFALLVGLVFGLGQQSASKVAEARYSTQSEERRLAVLRAIVEDYVARYAPRLMGGRAAGGAR